MSRKRTENRTEKITLARLVEDLIDRGGAIVPGTECSDSEIVAAMLEKRFARNSGGVGFVRRPQEWLDSVKEPKKAFITTY